MNPSETLSRVCALLKEGDIGEAAATITRDYPFVPVLPTPRAYTESQATRVFARDGFIDRYSGERLVFPGTLRLLSLKLPEAFPYHRNWKVSETHPAFWQFCATIDHVVPITRGGTDAESNLVTTSMLRNSSKGHWLIEELGWVLKPPGVCAEWDGLMSWFFTQAAAEPSFLRQPFIRRWHLAATQSAAAQPFVPAAANRLRRLPAAELKR
jgi:5-methylcytosine-specific restriction endonuclease McrA